MDRALLAVKEGCSSTKSARRFLVPKMSLSDRVKNKVAAACTQGRPPMLSDEEEESLVKYCFYMAEHRFPITRAQVIGLAWAIAVRQGKECFLNTGPTLRWWKGFRNRHPELRLRKPESIDRGRVANATEEIIGDYFETLKKNLEDNGLQDKPHLVFNCDEAGISLNKSTQKFIVLGRNKHCQNIAQGTNQHISVLCCFSASGVTIPPHIIFSKGLPALRTLQNDGC